MVSIKAQGLGLGIWGILGLRAPWISLGVVRVLDSVGRVLKAASQKYSRFGTRRGVR